MSRYSTPYLDGVWAQAHTLDLWRRVELAVLRAQAAAGIIPHAWALEAEILPPPTVEAWEQATADTGHEFVAFLTTWGAPHVHLGLTSSDITDTALSLQLNEATGHILAELSILNAAVCNLVEEVEDLPRVGRTHGQIAAPSTYGHLFDYWADGLGRSWNRLARARKDIAIAKISGPVGTYLHITPAVEAHAAQMLGLAAANHSTQIYLRDGIAHWVGVLGQVASVIEGIALELRLMGHEALQEATDGGGSTSSAMPHKINPNRLERLCGLARVVRAAYEPIAAGVPQWHDRDMAHSSVEKIFLPLASSTLAYMVRSLREILRSVRFDTVRILDNNHAAKEQMRTHSIQTALQYSGMSYVEAKDTAGKIHRTGQALTDPRPALAAYGAADYYADPVPR
jgi:adenylosuccinate lyase